MEKIRGINVPIWKSLISMAQSLRIIPENWLNLLYQNVHYAGGHVYVTHSSSFLKQQK